MLCAYGVAIGWWGGDIGEVSSTHKGELEGTWNRGGGHGEGIDVCPHLSKALFDGDAKLLLFINDEESSILINYILTCTGMGAYNNIYLTLF